jgi:hypothetical protein
MKYKEDWPIARKRIEAFWEGEIIDRCCVGVLSPRKTSRLSKFPHLTHGPWLGGLDKLEGNQEEIVKWWTDPEQNYNRMRLWFENTYFGGEAVPATYINWGASAGCAFWGSIPDFNTKSVWFHKIINDWETWSWNFEIEANKYWNIILDIINCFIEKNDGAYFIGNPEIGNAADNLSLIRGVSDLATDLILYPEAIKMAVEIMSDSWVKAHEQLNSIFINNNEGGDVLPWLNLWAPGKHDQMANDFSTMISTEQFKEFFFPELIKMGQWLDYGTYHLDGPRCIYNHTDALLELDEIKCIQFTPGAGGPPASNPEYIPIFQKIQAAGKNLYLLVDPHDIVFILSNLSSKGLFINTYADSQDEADRIIDKVSRLTRE